MHASSPAASRLALRPGSHVAVVGGGPAGSFFALCAQRYARRRGLDLSITVFEPRDFNRPGPRGCNMCAGLIPVSSMRELDNVGLEVPDRIIRSRISHYTLHTAAGRVHLPQPDPEADVYSVYRGNGLRDQPPGSGCKSADDISFDGLMLDTARSRGVQVIRERVRAISMRPRPTVSTGRRVVAADLVVLAAGVNRQAIDFTDMEYRPPPRRRMTLTELCPGPDVVRRRLVDSVHIILPRDGSVTFGTLVPKGPCVNVSLLGDDLPSGSLERFLALPEVTTILPDRGTRACSCRPHIAVGAAHPLYADRFVAVGDAGITRLYKNGIGAAMRTSRQAALCAVHRGVAAADFHAVYGPLCRGIALDNMAGRLLFAFTLVFQHRRRLTMPHLRSIAAEQELEPEARMHCRLLWGMFTGSYSYRRLLRMAVHPGLQARLLRHALAAGRGAVT